MVNVGKYTPQKMNVSTKKWTISIGKYVIQPLIFMGHVVFFGGVSYMDPMGYVCFTWRCFWLGGRGNRPFTCASCQRSCWYLATTRRRQKLLEEKVGGKRRFVFRFLAFVDAFFFAFQMSFFSPDVFFLDYFGMWD